MNNNIVVSIRCLVYNHEPYLRQCLDGFVMQKTNFKFEAIVHDDASTDKSADIIREYANKYPDIIKPIYEKDNQYSKRDGSLKKILDAHSKGKYIAFCEGDDYWTDPLKLQKQVDFLENNSEYVLSHTSIVFFYQTSNKFINSKDVKINANFKNVNAIDILRGYRIHTVSVVIRAKSYFEVINSDNFLYNSGYFLMGDTQLWYGLSQIGKIHFLPNVTCVYRKNDNSLTRVGNSKSFYRFSLSSMELNYYLCERDKLPLELTQTIKYKLLKVYRNYNAFDFNFTSTVIDKPKYDNFITFLLKSNILKNILVLKRYLQSYLGNLRRLFIKEL